MAYIYEHIRTQGYDPIYFEEHYTRLDSLARTYFHEPLKATREVLRKAIAECLKEEQFSPKMMNVVRVRCFADGTFKVEAGWMIYNTFSLRALHPQAHFCRVSGSLLTDNTSAKEALVEFNQASAFTANEGVAVWATEQGEVVAIDGAPVIAIFEDEIKFSRAGQGVEFDLAYDVVCKMKHKVVRGEIRIEELSQAKELLYIDYRGITAVQTLDNSTIYMDILAEKIAAHIAERESSNI